MDADVVFYLFFLDHTRENKKQNNLRGKTKKKAYEMSFVFFIFESEKKQNGKCGFSSKSKHAPLEGDKAELPQRAHETSQLFFPSSQTASILRPATDADATGALAATLMESTTALGGERTASMTCTEPAPAGRSSLTNLAEGAPAAADETETTLSPSLATTIGAISDSQDLSGWPDIHLEDLSPAVALTTCCLRMYLRSGLASSSALEILAASRYESNAASLGAKTERTVSGLSSFDVRLAALIAAANVEREGSALMRARGEAGAVYFFIGGVGGGVRWRVEEGRFFLFSREHEVDEVGRTPRRCHRDRVRSAPPFLRYSFFRVSAST